MTQLFVHVLAATALFGSVGAIAVLGFAAPRYPGRPALAVGALLATFVVAAPSWALMLAFGAWTKSREGWPGSTPWLEVGSDIAGAGIPVLLALAALAYWWFRRPASAWQPAALALVASGYLLALSAAWWVMTAKVPA